MRQGFACCEPSRRVKTCQTSDEIPEVRVKGLHVPSDERLTGILLFKAVPKGFQHLAPRAIAKVPQQPIKTFHVGKVRNLAFKYMGKCYLSFRKRLFINVKDDMLQYCIDALFHGISNHPRPERATPEPSSFNVNTS